eukprot:s1442_g5.t3
MLAQPAQRLSADLDKAFENFQRLGLRAGRMAISRALLFASLVGVDATCVGDSCAPRTDGPWLLQQSSRRGQLQSSVQVNATPSELMPCPGGAVLTTACMTAAQYDDVVTAVRGHLESLPAICTATDCPQADWAGCVLRMAGHDFMDFANGQGGADACTDMTDADNGGLPACLANGEHGISLREVYEGFCTSVSLADFLVIAAEAVIMSTRARHEAANPSAPQLDLRSSFRFGRTTAVTCDFAAGRLPNPENGCDAVEQTFLDGMGLDWTEAAALMGVHSLGRAQVSNSGYHGWWSDPENSRRFNNDYFVSLLAKGWIPELAVAGNAGKNQWERSDIGRDTSFDGHEMMLNSDLCLVYSENGRNGGPVLATEHDCCAWLTSDTIPGAVASNGGEYCGGNPGRGERGQCCGDQGGDCGDRNDPSGPAADAVLLFAGNEAAWLESFVRAWTIAIDNGHANLHALGQCPETTPTPSPTTATTSSTTTTTTTTTQGSTQSTTATAETTTLGTTTSSTPSTTSAGTTPATTRPSLDLLRGFRLVDGGVGRACRGEDAGDNDVGNFEVVSTTDLRGCQEACVSSDECRGVSFQGSKCVNGCQTSFKSNGHIRFAALRGCSKDDPRGSISCRLNFRVLELPSPQWRQRCRPRPAHGVMGGDEAYFSDGQAMSAPRIFGSGSLSNRLLQAWRGVSGGTQTTRTFAGRHLAARAPLGCTGVSSTLTCWSPIYAGLPEHLSASDPSLTTEEISQRAFCGASAPRPAKALGMTWLQKIDDLEAAGALLRHAARLRRFDATPGKGKSGSVEWQQSMGTLSLSCPITQSGLKEEDVLVEASTCELQVFVQGKKLADMSGMLCGSIRQNLSWWRLRREVARRMNCGVDEAHERLTLEVELAKTTHKSWPDVWHKKEMKHPDARSGYPWTPAMEAAQDTKHATRVPLAQGPLQRSRATEEGAMPGFLFAPDDLCIGIDTLQDSKTITVRIHFETEALHVVQKIMPLEELFAADVLDDRINIFLQGDEQNPILWAGLSGRCIPKSTTWALTTCDRFRNRQRNPSAPGHALAIVLKKHKDYHGSWPQLFSMLGPISVEIPSGTLRPLLLIGSRAWIWTRALI